MANLGIFHEIETVLPPAGLGKLKEMKYSKYHALGKDYIVLNPVDVGRDLDSGQIRLLVIEITESDRMAFSLVQDIGPVIEVDPHFPNRTNVQFMKVLDRKNIQIEIWERGASYTLASGSSSTAAAAVAYKLGPCPTSLPTCPEEH